MPLRRRLNSSLQVAVPGPFLRTSKPPFVIIMFRYQSILPFKRHFGVRSTLYSQWIFVAAATTLFTPHSCQAFSIPPLMRNRPHFLSPYRFYSYQSPEESQMTQDAQSIVNKAIDAVNAYTVVQKHMVKGENNSLQIGSHTHHQEMYDQILLVAFGKASSGMAKAVVERMEECMPNLPIQGVVICKDDHATQGMCFSEKHIPCCYKGLCITHYPYPFP